MNRPQACFDIGCPLAAQGQGFALPSGDIHTSRLAFLLETPATEEINYDLSQTNRRSVPSPWDIPDVPAELERRSLLYPHLVGAYLRRGVPVVGRSGMELFSWALRASGIGRRDVYIANVLQCYPGKGKDGTVAYPTGKDRKHAESCCASLWWRLDSIFKPDIAVINFHPAAIIRDVTPLSLQIAAFTRAIRFVQDGYKVLVCCGGKAAKAWFGYGDNVTRWVGHYQRETNLTRQMRAERFAQ